MALASDCPSWQVGRTQYALRLVSKRWRQRVTRRHSAVLEHRCGRVALATDEDVNHPALLEILEGAKMIQLAIEVHWLLALRAGRGLIVLYPVGLAAQL